MTEIIEVQFQEMEKYKKALEHIASICGNPDPQLACRLILLEVKEALA